jgi:hypothetical protein
MIKIQSDFSLREQIEEVEREIDLRRKVYPNQVRLKKMRQSIADYHLARMQAVLITLRQFEQIDNEI